jgi:prophage regulatory protein
MQDRPVEFLRLPEVLKRTGKSRSGLYADDTFPAQVKIGKRSVAWLSSEVQSWIDAQIRASRGGVE